MSVCMFTVQKGEGRSDRLDLLVSEAEKRVVDLTAAVLNSGNSAMSANQQKVHTLVVSYGGQLAVLNRKKTNKCNQVESSWQFVSL